VDLVVDQVVELHHVDVAHRGLLLERLAGASVVELRLAVLGQAGLHEALADVLFAGAVEDRRDRLEAELGARPAQVGFEDLTHVHAARHAQRVEEDFHVGAVGQVGHLLFGEDLGDHALVAVASGHLVPHRDHALGGDVHLDHLEHAAAKLVAALHGIELAVAVVDGRLDGGPRLLVDPLHLGLLLGAADLQGVEAEPRRLLGDVAVLLVLHQRRAVLVGQLALQRLLDLGDQGSEGLGDLGVALDLGLLEGLLELLALFFGEAHAARELLGVDHDPFDAGGHFQRIVLHVFAGPAEDRVQQLLLRGELGLGLGRDLAHQDVARPHVGPHADDAVLVQVAEGLFADVGDVAGELLAAELGFADLDVELLDVDRGVGIVLHELLADDDGILEVEPIPGHEGGQHVASQGQLSQVRAGAVGDHVALGDLLPHGDDRPLVLAGPLVEPHELAQGIDVAADLDPPGVDVGHRACVAGADQHAGVAGGVLLQAGGHQGRLGDHQGHRLALHVRPHQRPVGVVMLQEGDQAGRDAHHLAGGHVDVLHVVAGDQAEVAVVPGHDRIAHQAFVVDRRVGGGDQGLVLLVGAEPFDLVGELALLDDLVGRHQEAVLVDTGVDRQAGDQPDVGAFGGLDGADAAVVGDVHVADLESGPLPVQSARPQGREPPLVGEHGERVGLVDHLRQLAAAEEVLDRRRDALGVDQAPRRHVGHFLEAHPLLDRAAKLEEALAKLVAGQLVDGPQAAIAQVVDVVDLHRGIVAAELEQVLHGGDQVFGAEGHLVLGDVQRELPVDAEPADPPQPVPVGVVELLVEQRLRLLQLRGVAGAQALIDSQQRLLVAGGHVVRQGVEQEGALLVGHHLHRLQPRAADLLRGVLGDLLAAFHEDFTGSRAVLRIDHVGDGDLAFDLGGAAAVDEGLDAGGVEGPQDVGVLAVLGVHGPQQHHRRELAALVDADGETFLSGHVEFDPTAALGDDAAAVQAPLAAFHLDHEIDAGAAVQLADHHALRPVDDELPPAQHDGQVAEVHLLLDRLLLGEAQDDLHRPAVGEAQLAALVGLVAGLAQLVADILQAQRLVVALDGKDLAEDALQALVLALLPGDFVLQEGRVAAGLDLRQIGRRVGVTAAAEMPGLLGLQSPLGCGRHKELPSYKRLKDRATAGQAGARGRATSPPRPRPVRKEVGLVVVKPFLPAQSTHSLR